jgi:hypothetical protein
MPAVTFHKCKCGIQFKIVYAMNGRRLAYVCDCKRPVKIPGSLIDLYYTRRDSSSLFAELNWVKVPASMIEETLGNDLGVQNCDNLTVPRQAERIKKP